LRHGFSGAGEGDILHSHTGTIGQGPRIAVNSLTSSRHLVTAADMARANGIDPKRFRAALRAAGLDRHSHNGRWQVTSGSHAHHAMERVMTQLKGGAISLLALKSRAPRSGRLGSNSSDEAYIIDLCDECLGLKASRQNRFPFLVGDPDRNGRCRPLPVDAFYPELKLTVEYHERQHSERVGLFDDKPTVSGIPRGEQRRRYDQRRQVLLPKKGYTLVVFDFREFVHGSTKRLLRDAADRAFIEQRLAPLRGTR
jgi:hypothetical protein